MNKRRLIQHFPRWRSLRDNRSIRIALFVILGFIIYLSMLGNVMPERLNVELFSIADKDILSPDTVLDQEATEEKKAEAASAVSAEYTFEQKKALIQIEKTGAVYDSAKKVVENATREKQEEATDDTAKQPPQDERIDSLKGMLSEDTADNISEDTLATLVTSDPENLDVAKEVTNTTINRVMAEQISWDNLQKAKSSVKDQIPSSSLSKDLQKAVVEITRNAIIPNYMLNAEQTRQKRQEAIESVEPVKIREGQILVKKGHVINHEIYHQLQVVHLLDEEFNPYPYIGLALFVILMLALIIYELREIDSKTRSRNTYILMYSMVLFVTLLFMKITSLLEPLNIHGLAFIVPAAFGTMLVKMLINERLAMASSIILALCGSLIFNVEMAGTINFTYGIYILFSCLAGLFVLQKRNARPKILKTGLFVSVANMLIVALFLMLKTSQITTLDICLELGFAFLSGFIAAVLVLGLMPLFEAVFGILSTMRLIELSNPNHPLLRKILTEAPGTYHHSVMVANLAEAGCEAIGANGLLARVAAYYHDLGKTKRPRFFIENQMNMENPHDKISPQLSRTVILSHPYDGADMLRSHHMPKEIIDVAEQHHGTTLLQLFYHKARNENKDISESEFRYPGPKAQTRETAVIEIADGVEAAVRSMQKPTKAKIETLVKKIITDRLGDGQFDECDLTLKELDTIAKSICEALNGIFHSRIEYPEMELKKRVSGS